MMAAHVTLLRTFCSQSVTFTTTSHQTEQISKFKRKKTPNKSIGVCFYSSVCAACI